jgi:hypothetical protein
MLKVKHLQANNLKTYFKQLNKQTDFKKDDIDTIPNKKNQRHE